MSTLRLFLRADVTLFLMSILAVQMPRLATAFLAPTVNRVSSGSLQQQQRLGLTRCFSSSTGTDQSAKADNNKGSNKKGKLLVLGGTGFLGQTICKRAVLEGYSVTSLSRRGLPPLTDSDATVSSISTVDYRQGDARVKESIADILQEGGYTGVVHCIGLLFDNDSGLGSLNVFVSGSGSLLDSDSSYDTITRLTGFHAIDAAMEYAKEQGGENAKPLPFVFTSAAEAGWPDAAGGPMIEKLMPEFIQRYLKAKRAVEAKLVASSPTLRPIIVRPSLIYSMDRPTSYVPVGAFTVLNKVGLPFVDRPVTVQSVGAAIVAAMGQESVQGVLRYKEIDALNK
jgi:nucleoside-diphosphate-sugar epimerase